MLLLCNESWSRRSRKLLQKRRREAEVQFTKPLSLEYIADRLEKDNPHFGYIVRSEREGWLQGFISATTFATRHRWFEWNSAAVEAGITPQDRLNQNCDDGQLAADLQAQPHNKDPSRGVVVWPSIAEVSLLGGLGCGRQLMALLADELMQRGYAFLVLQSTDCAMGFYQSLGFTRVGAISSNDIQRPLLRQIAPVRAAPSPILHPPYRVSKQPSLSPLRLLAAPRLTAAHSVSSALAQRTAPHTRAGCRKPDVTAPPAAAAASTTSAVAAEEPWVMETEAKHRMEEVSRRQVARPETLAREGLRRKVAGHKKLGPPEVVRHEIGRGWRAEAMRRGREVVDRRANKLRGWRSLCWLVFSRLVESALEQPRNQREHFLHILLRPGAREGEEDGMVVVLGLLGERSPRRSAPARNSSLWAPMNVGYSSVVEAVADVDRLLASPPAPPPSAPRKPPAKPEAARTEKAAQDQLRRLHRRLWWALGGGGPEDLLRRPPRAGAEKQDTSTAGGRWPGSRFMVGVEARWEDVRGFRLFELAPPFPDENAGDGEGSEEAGKEENGPSWEMSGWEGREWFSAQEVQPPEGLPWHLQRFLPKKPRSAWVQPWRRCRVSETLLAAAVVVEVIAGSISREGGGSREYLCILCQEERVETAYAKLAALRAFEILGDGILSISPNMSPQAQISNMANQPGEACSAAALRSQATSGPNLECSFKYPKHAEKPMTFCSALILSSTRASNVSSVTIDRAPKASAFLSTNISHAEAVKTISRFPSSCRPQSMSSVNQDEPVDEQSKRATRTRQTKLGQKRLQDELCLCTDSTSCTDFVSAAQAPASPTPSRTSRPYQKLSPKSDTIHDCFYPSTRSRRTERVESDRRQADCLSERHIRRSARLLREGCCRSARSPMQPKKIEFSTVKPCNDVHTASTSTNCTQFLQVANMCKSDGLNVTERHVWQDKNLKREVKESKYGCMAGAGEERGELIQQQHPHTHGGKAHSWDISDCQASEAVIISGISESHPREEAYLNKPNKVDGQASARGANISRRLCRSIRKCRDNVRDSGIGTARGWSAYRHWTFPNQAIEDQPPSCMMVLRLCPDIQLFTSPSGSKILASVDPEVARAEGGDIARTFTARMRNIPPRILSTTEAAAFVRGDGKIRGQRCGGSAKERLDPKVHFAGRPGFSSGPAHEITYAGLEFKEFSVHFEGQRVKAVADQVGVDLDQLVAVNSLRFSGISRSSALKKATRLVLPPPIGQPGSWSGCPPAWAVSLLELVQELVHDQDGWMFENPVDPVLLSIPDYPFVITAPMDLGTVHTRLALGSFYPGAEAVTAHIRLVFDNALRYNYPGDMVWQAARRLLAIFEGRVCMLFSGDSITTAANTAPDMNFLGNQVNWTERKEELPRLYNKVVMLRRPPHPPLLGPSACTDGWRNFGRGVCVPNIDETGPFYVLHYVEGLHWCRLVPMRRDGVFPALNRTGKPHLHAGRPRWRLVAEGVGVEIDASGDRCRIVPSAAVSRATDPDRETWDVLLSHQPRQSLARMSSRTSAMNPVLTPPEVGIANPEEARHTKRQKPNQGLSRMDAATGNFEVVPVGKGHESGESENEGSDAWKDRCLQLVYQLIRKPQSWPFRAPVVELVDATPEWICEYEKIICTPMDLGTVCRHLQNKKYSSAAEVIGDLLLTFDNAIKYNPQTDKVHEMALEMRASLIKKCSKSSILSTALRLVLGGH